MRRFRRPPPQKLLSGREFRRLMSMLMMLAVLWMMITRASDPGVWRWLASDPDGGKKTAPPDDDEPVVAVAPPEKQPEAKAAGADAARSEPAESKTSDVMPAEPGPAENGKLAVPPVEPAVAASTAQDFEKLVPGPTDQDEEEWEAAKEEFQAITDRESLAAIDMPLYWRLVKWARAQTFDQLRQRAKTVSYVQLWDDPGQIPRQAHPHENAAFAAGV